MTKEYTYASIGDKYFCLQPSILFLSWILLFKYRSLHLESLDIQRRQIPRILKSLFKYAILGTPRSTPVITLPVFGHLCINVHQGHKLFNLSALRTTKFFDPDVNTDDACTEINTATEASLLEFAPTVLEVEANSRWYTETFVPGSRSLRNGKSNPGQLYKTVIVNHLSKMVTSRPVNTTTLKLYVTKLQTALTNQLENSILDNELRDHVQTFVETTVLQLESCDDITINLAFTHGDFSFVNFVYRGDTIWVIDWEDAMDRSLLHDMFNYFFTEHYYTRSQGRLDNEINNAIPLFLEHPEITGRFKFSDTADVRSAYRKLFYLERISMLLGRTASANRSRVIGRTLNLFSNHENAG